MSKNKFNKISELLRTIADRIDNNPKFIIELDSFLHKDQDQKIKKKEKEDPFVDIWDVYAKVGQEEFLKMLSELSIFQLVKIIQKNGLDQSKLSYKWKNKNKLIELIKDRIFDRTNKGKIFLEYGKDTNEEFNNRDEVDNDGNLK